jgi:hypothetical protein
LGPVFGMKSSRWRICTSCSDGRYQSSLHWRFQCNCTCK